jgi:hypothetical protein
MILILFTAMAGKEVGLQAVRQDEPPFPASLQGFPSKRTVDCSFTLSLSPEGEVTAARPTLCAHPVGADLKPTLMSWSYAPIGMATEHQVTLRLPAHPPARRSKLLELDWLEARTILAKQQARARTAGHLARAGSIGTAVSAVALGSTLAIRASSAEASDAAWIVSGIALGVSGTGWFLSHRGARKAVPALERWDAKGWNQLRATIRD